MIGFSVECSSAFATGFHSLPSTCCWLSQPDLSCTVEHPDGYVSGGHLQPDSEPLSQNLVQLLLKHEKSTERRPCWQQVFVAVGQTWSCATRKTRCNACCRRFMGLLVDPSVRNLRHRLADVGRPGLAKASSHVS